MSAVAAATHLIVSLAIYPGYYNSIWPHHSDYYIAAELAHTDSVFSGIYKWPRPVGFLFFATTGYLGTQGAIICNIALVFINLAITATLVRTALKVSPSSQYVVGCILYFFIVFTHPLQSIWSTYDVFSQLSYLFILFGIILTKANARVSGIFVAFLLAFLSKETYALSVGVIYATWIAATPRTHRRRLLRAGAAMILAFGAALTYSQLVKSPFVGSASETDPYHIAISLRSVFTEWWSYAGESGPGYWLCIAALSVVSIALHRPPPSRRVVALGVGSAIVAGCLAWAPNSLLPNHHMAGYSWNGAYFLGIPAVVAGATWTQGKRILMIVAAFVFATPTLSAPAYKKNSWVLEQQIRQKNIMIALNNKLRNTSGQTTSVLVSGLSFPFSPFERPMSLMEYTDILPDISIMSYNGKKFDRDYAGVRYVSPDEAKRLRYDEVWMFDKRGSLVALRLPATGDHRLERLGMEGIDLAFYPDVSNALAMSTAKPSSIDDFDGYQLLECGTAFLDYQDAEKALICLTASAAKIPDNPYPRYYAGVAHENLGALGLALVEYRYAVSLDDKKNANPAFATGVDRVSKKINAQSNH